MGSARRRRTLGSDDQKRVLVEIAVLASRVEFVARELLIDLIDPQHARVGVILARDLRFDALLNKVLEILETRLPVDSVARRLASKSVPRARAAMNARNEYLHARWHWELFAIPDAPATKFTHQRRTGRHIPTKLELSDLESTADAFLEALMGITATTQTLAQELDIESRYWERIYSADYTLNERDSPDDDRAPRA